MKKGFTVFLALMILFCAACCAGEGADCLTYAIYPLLPDPAYDQELIERRWAEVEPDIPLVRAEWNCYTDGAYASGICYTSIVLLKQTALQDLETSFSEILAFYPVSSYNAGIPFEGNGSRNAFFAESRRSVRGGTRYGGFPLPDGGGRRARGARPLQRGQAARETGQTGWHRELLVPEKWMGRLIFLPTDSSSKGDREGTCWTST